LPKPRDEIETRDSGQFQIQNDHLRQRVNEAVGEFPLAKEIRLRRFCVTDALKNDGQLSALARFCEKQRVVVIIFDV
jgi:hypothetical protein